MRLLLCLGIIFSTPSLASDEIFDTSRDRHIPLEISHPNVAKHCSETQPCSVALLSAGYGVPHTQYRFLSDKLNQLGYLVVAIGHELEGDPPLSTSGDLYQTRSENWQRGATTLDVVQHRLAASYPQYNFNALLLIGHSNGGDISAWFANNSGKHDIVTLITLDHRRVPLPRSKNIDVLSIRASDYPADDGVLPSQQEAQDYNIAVTRISEARHNDMTDAGPQTLRDDINDIIESYLSSIKNHVHTQH